MKIKVILLMLSLVLITSGCTTYRISMDLKAVRPSNAPVLIIEGPIKDRKYEKLAILEVSIEKNHEYFADPPKLLMDQVLTEKARILKADAVINVKYDRGMNWTTFGYLNAKGLAIKFIN